jgi:hypothetical protein
MTTTQKPTATSLALVDMITQMINDRKAFAAEHGFTPDDDEIADSIKASLVLMMKGA